MGDCRMCARYAIIVAGGRGLRMGGDLPKQFQLLGALPVLMHTLWAFSELVDELVLVLPQAHLDYWAELCAKYHFTLPHRVVTGGETRYHSVQNGLRALPEAESGLVAIHDGVRPLVTPSLITACFETAQEHLSALPTLPLTDSIRLLSGDSSRAVDRATLRAVQTPQTFSLPQLRAAYELGYRPEFTDDASVWESAGLPEIMLLDGERENIKLTTPEDLLLAELFLRDRKPEKPH